MNFRTTIVLLVLLIVVGVFFVKMERSDDGGYEEPADTGGDMIGTALFDADTFDAEAVEKVTIESSDKTVVLEKDGDEWKQVEPVRFALNSWSANRFGNSTADLRYVERFVPGDDDQPGLEQTGLSEPEATLALTLGGDVKTTHTFKLGKTLSIGGRGYLMLGDDPNVYIVNDALHELVLNEKPSSWRNKSLSGPKEGQADRVTLTRNGQAVELVKTDGNWALGAPDSGRVATKAVADLCEAVGRIYIGEFVKDQPQDLSIYGLDQPTTVLQLQIPPVTDSADEPQVTTLRIGAATDLKKEHFFATLAPGGDSGGDIVFTIGKADAEKLDKSVDDLRDPRVTLVQLHEVNDLKITQASGAQIGVARDGLDWKFNAAENPPYAPDGKVVSDLIDAIIEAEADAYTKAPDGDPLATVRLTAGSRPDPDVLKVFESEKKHRYAVVRNNETTGYLVPSDKLEGLFKPVLSLRQRTVIDPAMDRANRISITRPDGLALAFLRTVAEKPKESDEDKPAPVAAPGAWQLDGPEEFESKALDELIKAVDPLRADRWIAEPTTSAEKVFELVIATADGKSSTVRIDPASRQATADGVDGAFEVSQSLMDALDAEFRHRTVLQAANDDIRQITVARNGQAITIKKDADGKYVSSDGEAKIDQGSAGGLFDTVAGLRVERYISAPAKQDAAATITVQTNEATYVLKLAEGNTGTIDPAGEGLSWFTLGDDSVEKLTADVIEEE